jgi:hypothetical protein
MHASLLMTKVMLGQVCLVYVQQRFCLVRNLQIQRKNQVSFLSNSQEIAQIASLPAVMQYWGWKDRVLSKCMTHQPQTLAATQCPKTVN